MGIRLNKVITELNIGLQTAVEYLKLHHIGEVKADANPNTKITDDQYDALVKKFRVDKQIKANAAAIADKLFPPKNKEITEDKGEKKKKKKKKKKKDKIVSITVIKDYKDNNNQSKKVTKKVKFEERINDILSKLFYSHQTIDNIIEYWKQHRSDFNAITENWVRISIYGKDNLIYYKERMSKEFDNYRDVEESIVNTDSANEDETAKIKLKAFKDDIVNYIKRQRKIQNRNKTQKKVKEKVDKPVFNALKKKEWILDWNCVMFKRGSVIIYSRSTLGFSFKPTEVIAPHSLESFNYLKKYLNERLPPVRCYIVGQRITVVDKINFSNAIQQFQIAAQQRGIKIGETNSGKNYSPHPMSFTQALSRAKQMTPEDFQKYKSNYIDYLVMLQSKEYKVIPCVERLAHSTGDTTEYAFMFSIECNSGKVLIVHENVNPDRSTLLFLVKKESFNQSIREIYNFLQSAEINKRSSLRDKSVEIENAGILSYRSINHEDLYSWKQTISTYKRYR